MANEGKTKKDRILFTVLFLLALLPLEIAASIVAWETIGEITSGLLIIACIGFNLLAFFFSFRYFWPSIIAMLSFGLAIIWYQVTLVVRMHYVGAEAANIVHWAYSEKLKTGSFPPDLSGYVFLRPEYKKYIQRYEVKDKDRFSVDYYIETPTTPHGYGTEGGWSYYPD